MHDGLVPYDADQVVLATVNASWRRELGASELLACLRGTAPVADWADHLATFFTEVPLEAIERYIAAHRLPAERVLAAYRAVREITGEENPGLEKWLGELADSPA